MAEHIYDRGGSPDGALGISLGRFYGEEAVELDLVSGDSAAHLTAEQARAVAADLVAHADALDERTGGAHNA